MVIRCDFRDFGCVISTEGLSGLSDEERKAKAYKKYRPDIQQLNKRLQILENLRRDVIRERHASKVQDLLDQRASKLANFATRWYGGRPLRDIAYARAHKAQD
jgi:hypothetical protein